MRERGLEPHDGARAIKATGKRFRYRVAGDKSGSDNGWGVLHLDSTPAGAFGSWKTGDKVRWCAKSKSELSPAERAELARKRREDRRAQAEEQARVHAETAAKVQKLWLEARPATTAHSYLARKKVNAYGLKLLAEQLMIPMRDAKGVMHSIQWISSDGSKKFASGGRVQGCYYAIGKPRDGQPILIAEGYATAATLVEATGFATVCAFNSGNLTKVARIMREKFPARDIIICGDNDAQTKGNPGVTAATAAAIEIKAKLAFPRFDHLDPAPESATDFNDVAQLEGLDEVKRQVELAELVPKPNTTSAEPVNETHIEPAAHAIEIVPIDEERSTSIDMSTDLPDVVHGKNGVRVLSTIENLREICKRLGVTIRYNVISKDEEILIPGGSFTVDNRANASLAWLVSWCLRFRMPVAQIADYATYLADQNLYNPVAKWILSKPWDGVSRLSAICATVTARGEADDERVQRSKETLIRRWLLSAIAAAFEPTGVSAHGVLVFQGPQYVGKTQWFKSLVPQHLGVTADGMILVPADRDSVKQAVSFWLVELGEIDATFRKSDIAQLKAFLTKDKDVLRRAFARKESEYARRTVFFASVNPKQYLHDPTGNRRYWTIECEAIDHTHKIDMQQLWAEIYTLYRFGERWFLEPEEMALLNLHNEQFEVSDPVEEKLLEFYDWETLPIDHRFKTASEIMVEMGFERPSKHDLNVCANVVRKLNGGREQRTMQGRKLLVPRKAIS